MISSSFDKALALALALLLLLPLPFPKQPSRPSKRPCSLDCLETVISEGTRMIERNDQNDGVPMEPPAAGRQAEAGNSGTKTGSNRRPLGEITNRGCPPPNLCDGSKREPKLKCVADENNRPCRVAHRPITRSYAATALRMPNCSQTQKDASGNEVVYILVSPTRNRDASDATDTDVGLPIKDVSPRQQALSEKMVIGEAGTNSSGNTDGHNMDDPRGEADYVNEMYRLYRELENTARVNSDYMSHQPELNHRMRAILIDWLIEVHYKYRFNLEEETLFLTVSIIDRFLDQQPVNRSRLQLVGVSALLIASKYEKTLLFPPVEDLISLSNGIYRRDEILEMEMVILNTLKFTLSVPTPYVFMRRCLYGSGPDEQMEFLSLYLIQLSLVEYEMLKFPPSLLGAAAVFTAQSAIKGSNHWSRANEINSHYTEEELIECAIKMVDFHVHARTSRLNAVYRKFSLPKFGHVARLKPAHFLLNMESSDSDSDDPTE